MVFCGESIITEISVYVSFYMSEFIIQSTVGKDGCKPLDRPHVSVVTLIHCVSKIYFFELLI